VRGTVVGEVAGRDGVPLSGVVVKLEGIDIGTLTDSVGRFRLASVPVGRRFVRVQTIGFAVALREVAVEPRDSVYVSFVLREIPIPFAGAGYPLPDEAHLAQAQQLLPAVLNSVRAEELLPPEWLTESEPLVWVPWTRNVASAVAGFLLRTDCAGCWSSAPSTFEGGRQFRVATAHLRLGVYSDGPGYLTFCIDPGESGDVLPVNCYGSGVTAVLHYTQVHDGRWIQTAAFGGLPRRPL
jgi:hypothetical protein